MINKPYMYISPSVDKKTLTAKIAKNSGWYETTSIMGDQLLCGFIELRESTYPHRTYTCSQGPRYSCPADLRGGK